MNKLVEQFSHSVPWNQSVLVSYNFMETNSSLIESGEKYAVFIYKLPSALLARILLGVCVYASAHICVLVCIKNKS